MMTVIGLMIRVGLGELAADLPELPEPTQLALFTSAEGRWPLAGT